MKAESLIEVEANPDIPPFGPGDTVRVHAKVVEGDRERIQVFQGVVLGVKGGGIRANFTVRRTSHGVGVERTFFMHSPRLSKLEVMRRGKVRRAKLFYLRGLTGKAARVKEKARETVPKEKATGMTPKEKATGTTPKEQATGMTPEEQATDIMPEEQATDIMPEEQGTGTTPKAES